MPWLFGGMHNVRRSDMDYSVDLAKQYIGKRIIASLRHIQDDGRETYSGFWGRVESAHESFLLLKIEGGKTEPYWEMPPDLNVFQSAKHERYEFGDSGIVVTDVDFEAYYATAASPGVLQKY